MMMKFSLLLFLCFFTQIITSQKNVKLSPIQKQLYEFETVQVKPEFNGGKNKFVEYILDNLKKTKTGKTFKGTISLNFIVEMDGSISNVFIVSDLKNQTKKDLKTILLKSPKWLCAEHEGYHVRTKIDFAFDVV